MDEALDAVPLSLVITCPLGLGIYRLPEEFYAEMRAGTLEVLLADGRDGGSPTDGCTHVRIPGAHVFALRREAIRRARHEWVVMTEDHCRFRPDWLHRLRETIRRNPQAELISGTVVSDSTTGAWSQANYLFTFYTHRRGVDTEPGHSQIAHAMLRKSAILAEELAQDGGFEFQTLARLQQSGRFAYCREAVVDHVLQTSFGGCTTDHYHNARACYALIRARLPVYRPRHILRNAGHAMFVRPRTIMRAVAGTADASAAIFWRVCWIGLLNAVGSLHGYYFGGGRSLWKVV